MATVAHAQVVPTALPAFQGSLLLAFDPTASGKRPAIVCCSHRVLEEHRERQKGWTSPHTPSLQRIIAFFGDINHAQIRYVCAINHSPSGFISYTYLLAMICNTKCMNLRLWLFLLVWPSENSSLTKFVKLIRSVVFLPSPNTTVKVELSSQVPDDFPLEVCGDCQSRFSSSRVVEAVREVKWELLHSSTYDLLKTVSSTCKHALSVHTNQLHHITIKRNNHVGTPCLANG